MAILLTNRWLSITSTLNVSIYKRDDDSTNNNIYFFPLVGWKTGTVLLP